jgi:adenylate cyclase
VGLVISPFDFALNIEENTGLGLLFKLRGARQAPSDVVVVSIDRESSEKLNLPDNPDKWPRSVHARLTENLAREGARVVAFGVHFIEPRSAESDNLFAEAIRKARNVVLAEPLKAKEVPLSDTGGSQAGVHSIVKIVKPISLHYYILMILLWSTLMGIFCRISPMIVAALGAVGLSVLYLVAAQYQFKTNNIWSPIIIPLFIQTPFAFLGAVVWNYVDTNKERQKIRKALEYHLPKNVVDQLATNIAQIKTSGEVVHGICLTTDAEHYTTLSETMDPQELASFMNRYYEAIFKPTRHHGGVVSDIIGDSMMALWVASRPETSPKDKACFAAVDIQKSMQQFNQSSGAVQVNTRIGLHSGHISLGHIGAIDHYEYRPVGDIVNTASRIEGLNKHLGTRVLVSEEVIHQLDSVLTRQVGQFRLKGKAKPITIYELMCRIEESDEKQRGACAIFAEAMGAFRRQAWDEAMENSISASKIVEKTGHRCSM